MNNNIFLIFNFFHLIFLIYLLSRNRKLPKYLPYFFIITSLPSLFLVGKLFNIHYMWDISIYLDSIIAVRELTFDFPNPSSFGFPVPSLKTLSFSLIYSISPFFFINDFQSLGLITRLFYYIFILYLYNSNIFRKNKFCLLVLIFSPSILIYSNLGLREILVTIFITLYLFFSNEKKFFYLLIILIPLFLIKPQNAIIIVFFQILFFLLTYNKYNLLRYLLLFIVTLMTYFLFLDQIIELLNFYREALFKEAGKSDLYSEINILNILFIGLISTINFLFSPLPDNIDSITKLTVFVENILLYFYIAILSVKSFKVNKKQTFFILFLLFFSSFFYGIISINDGAIARWRFPLVFSTIIYLNYLFQKKFYFSIINNK